MRKRERTGKKSRRLPIRVSFVRHSYRDNSTAASGLSPQGISAAYAAGKKWPKQHMVAGRHSSLPLEKSRTRHTLELGIAAHHEAGGTAYEHVRKRKNTSFQGGMFTGKNGERAEKRVRDMVAARGEETVLREWLRAKLPRIRGFRSARETANHLIVHELSFGKFLRDRDVRGINVRYQSHSWMIDAVFERLTGKNIFSLTPKGMVRENEGLEFFHYANGKIILHYRGQSYDVTRRYLSVLQQDAEREKNLREKK